MYVKTGLNILSGVQVTESGLESACLLIEKNTSRFEVISVYFNSPGNI